jgi:hypothetical protein
MSTTTLLLLKSMGANILLLRKRELGSTEPTMRFALKNSLKKDLRDIG